MRYYRDMYGPRGYCVFRDTIEDKEIETERVIELFLFAVTHTLVS